MLAGGGIRHASAGKSEWWHQRIHAGASPSFRAPDIRDTGVKSASQTRGLRRVKDNTASTRCCKASRTTVSRRHSPSTK
jgi:hypothetical protein